MPKFRLYVHTGFAGCDHEDEYEIPDDEWDDMTREERDEELEGVSRDFMHNNIEWGYYRILREEAE